MTVCFFGIYNPDYSRNRILLNGLKENGVKVIEINSRGFGWRKYWELFWWHWKIRKQYDLMIVAFPGYQAIILAKLICRKKIVFDAFNSIYDTAVNDRKKISRFSPKAWYLFLLNKLSCMLASKVILDTNAHVSYFVKAFKLRPEKFFRLWVGSDNLLFFPRPAKKVHNRLVAHFHGTYIPLHGIEYILKAAKILENEDIIFNLVGAGQTYVAMQKLNLELNLRNVNFFVAQPPAQLAELMAGADICLGIFGSSAKASRVIPCKVYDALAMGKAVITGESPAVKELLQNKKNVLFCLLADAQDLADKILFLKNNQKLCHQLAENGYYLYQHQLTPLLIGRQLVREINEVLCN